MKKISKLLVLILTLALVLSLAACSKQGIADTWTCNMDMNKIMTESGALDEMSGSGISEEQKTAMVNAFTKLFDGVNMKIVLDLKEDNTFTMGMDEDSIKAASESLNKNLPNVMPELLAALFGVSADELDDTLSSMGTTMDDMIASMGDELGTDDMLDSMKVDSISGTYTYEEGKLVLTAKDEDGTTNETVMTVELGSDLKVTAIEGSSDFDGFEKILPMVFTR